MLRGVADGRTLHTMWIRSFVVAHPRLSGLLTVVASLLLAVVLPRLTHEPTPWPGLIFGWVLLGSGFYLLRTRGARAFAYFGAGVSLVALLFWVAITIAQGIPENGPDRLAWAGVIAFPVIGLIASWQMYRRTPGSK